MSFVCDAEKVLKVAQEIVEVMKKADLTEEEAMNVMNVLDITLFPAEYDDGYDEEFVCEDSCLCPILAVFSDAPSCDGCDDCDGCEGCEFHNDKK